MPGTYTHVKLLHVYVYVGTRGGIHAGGEREVEDVDAMMHE